MIINISTGLGAGGAERALKNLYYFFKKYNQNLQFFVVSLTNDISKENVNFEHKIFNLRFFNIINLWKLYLYLYSFSNEKNVKYFFWMYDACFVSLLLSPFLKKNINWYIHHNLLSPETDLIKHKIFIRLLSYFSWFKFVDNIYFVSHQSMSLHIEKFNFCKDKCIYFPNGIDFCSNNRINVKKEFKKEINIGCFGRYTKVKNHDLLFEICQKLKMKGISVKLHLAGIGLESNNTDLVKKLDCHGIRSDTILYGQVNNISTLYKLVDIYILCSFSEAFPMVVLEALLHGNFVVSSNVGDVNEIIKDNGVVLPDYSVDKYINSVINYLNLDYSTRIDMATIGHEHVINTFSFDSLIKNQPIFNNFIE